METIITAAITVPVAPEAAFRAFTAHMLSWWPKAYTWSQQTIKEMAIEPRPGGRCYETGPHQFHCDWGRVLDVQAPDFITFTWQIGPTRAPEPDPDKAGQVSVRFGDAGSHTTRVLLEHSGFNRYGKDWETYAAAMASEKGWPYILAAFRSYLEDN